jgi:hypothetical protein
MGVLDSVSYSHWTNQKLDELRKSYYYGMIIPLHLSDVNPICNTVFKEYSRAKRARIEATDTVGHNVDKFMHRLLTQKCFRTL